MSNFVVAFVIAAAIIALAVWFYSVFFKRSTREVAFVRTGLGGQKVVLGGGAFVIPIFHETMPVNLMTQRLGVHLSGEHSLLTLDKMRVDMVVDFYVRVSANPDAIALAAQALGRKSMDPDALNSLLEAKFVDAMRSVAATMNMDALHKNRSEFITSVTDMAGSELARNGLELETTSLSAFNQTSKEFFDPSNAFDAEGLTRLTAEIEARKKDRNDIEQDSLISIRSKNLEAEKTQLAIERESETARLTQDQDLAAQRAATESEISKDRAERKREADIVEINAALEVERARIDKECKVQQHDVARKLSIDLAEQERVIKTAQSGVRETEAKAASDIARAEAIKAEEAIYTARETAQAERKQGIEMILTAIEVEKRRLREVTAAETEKAMTEIRSDIEKLEAATFAEATATKAEGYARRHAVEAEALRLKAEAENVASDATRSSRLRLRLLDRLEGIIRESVRPMEKIGDVRIVDLGIGRAPQSGGEDGTGDTSLSDQLVSSALRYRSQAPLVDRLLKEVGLAGGDISDLQGLAATPSQPKEDE